MSTRRSSSTIAAASVVLLLAMSLVPIGAEATVFVWGAGAAIPTGRYSPAAAALGGGRVLVAGGSNGGALSSAYVYDDTTGAWTSAAPLPVPTQAGSAAPISANRALFIGGVGTFAGAGTARSNVYQYDGATNAWSPVAPLSTARYNSAAAPIEGGMATGMATGRVLVVGGTDFAGAITTAAEVYDASTGAWSTVAPMPQARGSAAAAPIGNGRVLVVGGYTLAGVASNAAQIYDSVTNTWSVAASMATARGGLGGAPIGNGRVVVAGGNNAGGVLSTSEIYDSLSNSWFSTDSLTTARHAAAMSASGYKRVLLSGGATSSTVLSSSERYETPRVIGPDAFGYVAMRQPYAFTDIRSTGTRFLDDADDGAAQIPIGFPFRFYGVDHSTAFASTNGLLTFGAGTGAYGNTSLSSLGLPVIAPLWDDWMTSGVADALYYETVGTAPDRTLTVQWRLLRPYDINSTDTVDFQAVLYEASNNIDFRWRDTNAAQTTDNAHDHGISATVGIANPSAGAGLTWSLDEAVIVGPMAVRFTYPRNSAPTVTLEGLTHGAMYELGDVPSGSCHVSDVEDGTRVLAPSYGPITGPVSGQGLGSQSATCTYTDSGGLTASTSVTYAIGDSVAPALTVPGEQVAEATGPDGAVVSYPPATASDAVDGPVTAICVPVSGTTFALGTTTVTCSATDGRANTATDSFSVRVVDSTPPTLALPASFTSVATSTAGAVVRYEVGSAQDVVDGAVATSCSPMSSSSFPLGNTSVRCTATDAAGNVAIGSFGVSVQDRTQPVVTVPASLEVEATSAAGGHAGFVASAVDEVDGPLPVTCTPASGELFGFDATPVRCDATDAAGNTGSGAFTVTVVDTTPPQFDIPADQVVEATSSLGAPVEFDVGRASDAVDGEPRVSCDWASGGNFPIGTTTVGCVAADRRGNESRREFTITVRDSSPPTLMAPGNVTIEATGPDGAVVNYTGGSANDVVDGPLAVLCDQATGIVYPVGTTTVDCSATDARGNTARASFLVDVIDTTAPTVSVPANLSVAAVNAAGAPVTYGAATATDVVDGLVGTTCDRSSGDVFPLGVTHVHCTATDSHDNIGRASFLVTVQDESAPQVAVPVEVVVEATGPAGATVTYPTATADDNVDGPVPATCVPGPGSLFAIGTTPVGCAATDSAGNEGRNSFGVKVQDTTAPTLVLPGDIAAVATTASGVPVAFEVSAFDIVDGSLPAVCNRAAGSVFEPGTTTVSCTATDAHGNPRTKTFVVTVTISATGALAPIRADGLGVHKLGSTVPVKFQLTGPSSGISDLVARLYVARISDGAAGEDVPATSTVADAGNLFRYDQTARQYIFNLGTRPLPAGTWRLRVDLGDGVHRYAQIALRR